MLHLKLSNTHKAALAIMVALLAEVLTTALSLMDASMVLQESQQQPFSLPEQVWGLPLVQFCQYLGLSLGGLLLVFLPAAMSRIYTLMCGLTLLIVACVMTAFASSVSEVACWRFLAGAGGSIYTCAWISIGVSYLPRHSGMVIGCFSFISCIAWIITPFLPLSLANFRGWYPSSWWLAGIVVLLLLFLFLLFLRLFEGASVQTRVQLIVADAPAVALSVWSPAPLLLALASVCLPFALYGVTNIYGEYLREMQNFPGKTIRLIVGTYALVGLLAPVGGWLLDRYGSYTILVVALPLTGAVGGVLFMGWQMPLPAQVLLSALTTMGVGAVLYIGSLAALIQSLASSQSMRAAALFMAFSSFPLFFVQTAFFSLHSTWGWRVAALLCITGSLLLAAALFWLARNKLQRACPVSRV